MPRSGGRPRTTPRTPPQQHRADVYAEFAAEIARRREETGITDIARNDGTRRTASKRALLKAIADAGGTW